MWLISLFKQKINKKHATMLSHRNISLILSCEIISKKRPSTFTVNSSEVHVCPPLQSKLIDYVYILYSRTIMINLDTGYVSGSWCKFIYILVFSIVFPETETYLKTFDHFKSSFLFSWYSLKSFCSVSKGTVSTRTAVYVRDTTHFLPIFISIFKSPSWWCVMWQCQHISNSLVFVYDRKRLFKLASMHQEKLIYMRQAAK